MSVFLFNGLHLLDVDAATECDQMRIVGWCRVGYGAITTRKQVAQIVCERLQLVDCVVAFVHQNAVLGWLGHSLDARVRAQKKVVFLRAGDHLIHNCAGRNIVVPAVGRADSGLAREEARMMALLHNDQRQFGLVAWLHLLARLYNALSLFAHHKLELPLGHPVAIVEDFLREIAVLLLEVHQLLLDDGAEVLDDFNASGLQAPIDVVLERKSIVRRSNANHTLKNIEK